MTQLGQDTQGLAYRFKAYCKRDILNMFYLISFQSDRVVPDGDVK